MQLLCNYKGKSWRTPKVITWRYQNSLYLLNLWSYYKGIICKSSCRSHFPLQTTWIKWRAWRTPKVSTWRSQVHFQTLQLWSNYDKKWVHEGVQFPCTYCTYKAIANGSIPKHQKEAHEGVKNPCKHCSYIATWKGSLKEHQESVREGVKYLCKHCSYEAATIGFPKEHKK